MAGLFAYGCEKLRYKSEVQPSQLLDPVRLKMDSSNCRKLMLGTRLSGTRPASMQVSHTSHCLSIPLSQHPSIPIDDF
jgi:hypothetical protein